MVRNDKNFSEKMKKTHRCQTWIPQAIPGRWLAWVLLGDPGMIFNGDCVYELMEDRYAECMNSSHAYTRELSAKAKNEGSSTGRCLNAKEQESVHPYHDDTRVVPMPLSGG